MATCTLCQRSGFLLSLDQYELCESCANIFDKNYDLLNSFRKHLSYCRQSKDVLGYILAKLQNTRNLTEILNNQEIRPRWERTVNCDLNSYFAHLKEQGYIQKANGGEILELELSESQMKNILERIGQKSAGSKFEMAKMIMHFLPETLNAYQDQSYVVCTDSGKALAEFYCISQKNWNFETAKVIFFLVSKKAFLLALQVMVNHSIAQIETPENDLDWRQYDLQQDASFMNMIYQRCLSKYSLTAADEALSRNFTAYSMIFRDETFEDTIIGPDTLLNEKFFKSVTDTISFCQAQYEIKRIKSVKKLIRYIQIETANDDYVCPACKAASEVQYRINSLPEIPIEGCTSEVGCRCKISASI